MAATITSSLNPFTSWFINSKSERWSCHSRKDAGTTKGLFCASINFLEHSSSYSAPQWSFGSFSGKLWYGTLPREAVCTGPTPSPLDLFPGVPTENLTPCLKLLPYRDKAGISSLMDRPFYLQGDSFTSMNILQMQIRASTFHQQGYALILQQTLVFLISSCTKYLYYPVYRSSVCLVTPVPLTTPNFSMPYMYDNNHMHILWITS